MKRNLSKVEVDALLREEVSYKAKEATFSEREVLRNELAKQIQKCQELNETEAVKNLMTLLHSFGTKKLFVKAENETCIHFELEAIGEQSYSETYFFIVDK